MKRRGGYLRVRNLEQYQHYQAKNPAWVKLYASVLEDYDFSQLPDASKYHALALIVLASRMENHLPGDAGWVGSKISASDVVDLDSLVTIGFLRACDCEACSLKDPEKSCKTLDSEKRRVEGETEESRADSSAPKIGAKPANGSTGDEAVGEGVQTPADPPSGPEPQSPAVLEYPTTGKVKAWQLSEAQVAEWATLYPGLDVLAECRKALAWVKANPGRQKTDRGMPRMLANWLNRAVDSGGGRGMTTSTRRWAGRPTLEPDQEWLDAVSRKAEGGHTDG